MNDHHHLVSNWTIWNGIIPFHTVSLSFVIITINPTTIIIVIYKTIKSLLTSCSHDGCWNIIVVIITATSILRLYGFLSQKSSISLWINHKNKERHTFTIFSVSRKMQTWVSNQAKETGDKEHKDLYPRRINPKTGKSSRQRSENMLPLVFTVSGRSSCWCLQKFKPFLRQIFYFLHYCVHTYIMTTLQVYNTTNICIRSSYTYTKTTT